MAAHPSPHPLVYAPEHSDAAGYYQHYAAGGVHQQFTGSYYYQASQPEPVASSYTDVQDTSAVAVVSNQVSKRPRLLSELYLNQLSL